MRPRPGPARGVPGRSPAPAANPPEPYDHFFDLEGANVGFKRWHPVPVTQNGGQLSGQGDMGGAWEWTSTALDKHDGFEPMKLYPVYTGE